MDFMSEKNPYKNKETSVGEESFEQLVNQVRGRLVYELEQAMKTYGPGWVNKENCTELIDDLMNKRPTKIGGPLWGDFLDGVLYDLGMRSRTDGRYEAVWRKLEKGAEEITK